MKITCPGCAATGSIELFTSDVDARHCVQLAAKLPPVVGHVIFQYLSLFRAGERGLQWKRARTLLEELEPAISSGVLRRHRRDWAVSADAWRRGFDQMLAQRDKLTLPLKSHGYLYEVLTGVADKAEAEQERQQEQQRRVGSRVSESAQLGDIVGTQKLVQRSWVAGENAVRARTGLAPMNEEEEREYLMRMERAG